MAHELDVLRSLPMHMRDLFGTSRRLNRFFDDIFDRMGEGGEWDKSVVMETPRMDVNETEDMYLVSCEMPGVPKDNISIQVEGDRVRVRGERHEEIERGKMMRKEHGTYEQSFTLPSGIDPEKIEAEHKDGILYLAVPKSEKQKARRIEIGSGEKNLLGRIRGKSKPSKAA